MSRSIKELLLETYTIWKDAIQNKRGFLASIIALLAIVLLSLLAWLLVKLVVLLLPILTTFTLITIILAVTITTMLPRVARYANGILAFAKYKERYTSLNTLPFKYNIENTLFNSIHLSTIGASINIKFHQFLNEPNLEILLTNGENKDLKFLIKEENSAIWFTQAPSKNKLTYDLIINLPEHHTNLTINGRLIEGKLNIEGLGTVNLLKLEAINSLLSIENTTVHIAKVYGLNLSLDFNNVSFNDFAIRGTGHTFKFNFHNSKRGLELKIPNINTLSGYYFNNNNLARKIKHGHSNVWKANNTSINNMLLEISVIGAKVEINNTAIND